MWLRVVLLSACVILCSVGGNCLLSQGVKSQTEQAGVVSLLLSPWVVTGIVLLVGWMLFRMALLSISPMSIILPLTAGVAYLLTSLAGQLILHEKVGQDQGWGLSLIFIGVLLIGTSGSRNAGDAE